MVWLPPPSFFFLKKLYDFRYSVFSAVLAHDVEPYRRYRCPSKLFFGIVYLFEERSRESAASCRGDGQQVYLDIYGCQMNLSDAELVLGYVGPRDI